MPRFVMGCLALVAFTSYAGLNPNVSEETLASAKASMQKHLEQEGLTIDDAKLSLAYKDGRNKSTVYFEVAEHNGGAEIYKVVCSDEKCHLQYR
ncbi:hypothetical protein [Vibrio sp. 10N]|uniref:hypothetical protein n=1 Tax=Vibrio sp. 10N TaxID=3058938 RepID=UPI00281488AC|nr:hypothetical protein VB10N_45610 [Vibrio sp. 10N]